MVDGRRGAAEPDRPLGPSGQRRQLLPARGQGERQTAQPAAEVTMVVMIGRARHRSHPFDASGMALIGVMVLTAMLMALAGALALAVRSDTQLRGAFGSGVTGFYAAEAGLNKGMGEYRNIFLDYNVPHGADFDPRTVTVGNRNVTYQMAQRLSAAPCEA